MADIRRNAVKRGFPGNRTDHGVCFKTHLSCLPVILVVVKYSGSVLRQGKGEVPENAVNWGFSGSSGAGMVCFKAQLSIPVGKVIDFRNSEIFLFCPKTGQKVTARKVP